MPWQISYAAYTESDSDELQTDVMRFMAILAFCLVAIFAIVQSIPATPAPVAQPAAVSPRPAPESLRLAPEPPTPATETDIPARAVSSAAVPAPLVPVVLQRAEARPTKPAEPVRLRRAKPAPARPAPRPVPLVAQRPDPPAVVQTPRDRPPSVPAAGPGLSLRFESDVVLRNLVARGLVDLYAISGDRFYAMTVTGAQVRFQSGAAPAQYHEMIAGTVPDEVRASFGARGADVIWGVTLPAATSRQLARFVKTRYSGSLVITSDAQLALDAPGGV